MEKYNTNLASFDKIRKTNKKLNEIDKILHNKYTCNTKTLSLMHAMLNESIDKYHSIIRNLDGFLS